MPSILIEYSPNIVPAANIRHLVRVVHQAAFDSGLFALDNIRTRATPLTEWIVGDGKPENGLVQITARIKAGRSLEVQQEFARGMLEAARDELAAVYDSRPFALHLEVTEVSAVSIFHRTTDQPAG